MSTHSYKYCILCCALGRLHELTTVPKDEGDLHRVIIVVDGSARTA